MLMLYSLPYVVEALQGDQKHSGVSSHNGVIQCVGPLLKTFRQSRSECEPMKNTGTI